MKYGIAVGQRSKFDTARNRSPPGSSNLEYSSQRARSRFERAYIIEQQPRKLDGRREMAVVLEQSRNNSFFGIFVACQESKPQRLQNASPQAPEKHHAFDPILLPRVNVSTQECLPHLFLARLSSGGSLLRLG